MTNVASNIKLITSNTVPTTSNLPKGNLAFGQVNGENKIYGNIGSQVVEFTADGEPIIYFETEDDLNNFLTTADVPTGGWYAAVAEEIYDSDTVPGIYDDGGKVVYGISQGYGVDTVSVTGPSYRGSALGASDIDPSDNGLSLDGFSSQQVKLTINATCTGTELDQTHMVMTVSFTGTVSPLTINGVISSDGRTATFHGSTTFDMAGVERPATRASYGRGGAITVDSETMAAGSLKGNLILEAA